jgi:pimeloyl-ACP methyl ester carboxylesterase
MFESGLNSPGGVWGPVQERVSETARACWYDRAGTGRSQNRPEERITSAVLAAELGSLLRAARVPPPYLLVAHSIGGFSARLFAAKHPDEVAGLVLVDTTASDWPTLREELPEGNSTLDARASGAEVEAAQLQGGKPLAVIRHGQPEEGFTPREERRFTRAQERLARSTGNGLEIVALKSGHEIPTVQPELVALIVRSVLAAARAPALTLACPSHLDRVGAQCPFASASK